MKKNLFVNLLMFLSLVWCLSSVSTYAANWLQTSGNHIIDSNGNIWVGRGANLHDTRSCGDTLDDGTPLHDNSVGVSEVKRRIDLLTDEWHANFIRLALESRRTQDNYFTDANYRSIIKEIVDYIGTKQGVYVLISIWLDPTLEPEGTLLAGSPTADTDKILAELAKDFYAYPYVLYGVSNEPENNLDGGQDAQVWTRMNNAVQAIRDAESQLGPNRHIVTVQGARDFARDLGYYADHPITAGSGVNIAYETHIYNPPSDFATLLLLSPTPPIPIIIGEYGPVDDEFHSATVSDLQTLIDMANANNIPHLAWTFHQNCPPNLIANEPSKTWDAKPATDEFIDKPIFPTDFGQFLISNLRSVYQADCLFNWAEAIYPSLLAPTATSLTFEPWYYRYYSQTDTHAGISSIDNHVYYRGPDTDYAIQDLGELSDWLTSAGCS